MVFAVGPAGTGKTYTGYGYQGSKEKQVKRIILRLKLAKRILVFFLGYERKMDPYMQPL
jgi:phosphate starvation-inducible PhoH-like protein